MRHMALQYNRRLKRESTPEENKALMPYAMAAMVYAALLNRYYYDLHEAVKLSIKNPQKEIPEICRAHKKAEFAHGELFKAFNRANPRFGAYYNIEVDKAVTAIEEHVAMADGERAYSIVLALLDIVKENNDRCGRWRCPAIVDMYCDARRLRGLKLPFTNRSQIVKRIIVSAVDIDLKPQL